MKKLLMLFALTITLLSCSVKEEVLPDLGARVEGTYNAWYLESGNTKINLPTSNASLAISLKRVGRITASYTISTVVSGKITNSSGNLSLDIDNSDGTIDLIDNGKLIGFVDGNELTIDGIIDGAKTVIYADKK